MRRNRLIFVIAIVTPLGGCLDKNSVLFVTDTSLGINFETKPPTTSIAYDRIEGYFAPTYDDGNIPPVVASIGLGGDIFQPQVRQLYATGAAALKATKSNHDQTQDKGLKGNPNAKKLAFFGTSTTVGLKVGWAAETGAPLPDSFVFGYRRKEFSLLPLGTRRTTSDQDDMEIYPSVLAYIDSTTAVGESRMGTGLDHLQFFATGGAAEALAVNETVQNTFQYIAASSAAASLNLTPEEVRTAEEAGVKAAMMQMDHLTAIMNHVAPDNALDKQRLSSLVSAANARVPNSVSETLVDLPNADAVRARIRFSRPTVEALFAALPP